MKKAKRHLNFFLMMILFVVILSGIKPQELKAEGFKTTLEVGQGVSVDDLIRGLENSYRRSRGLQPLPEDPKNPRKPKIKVLETGNPGEVMIKIGSTKYAEGYGIYIKGEKDKDFHKLKTIEMSGDEKRHFTAKDLKEGEYSFRVRAYKKKNGKTVWGKYSETATITVGTLAKKMDAIILNKYPKLYDFVKTRKSQLTMVDKDHIYFSFGSYDMLGKDDSYDGKKEAIDWIVLDYDEAAGKALITTRYLLDKRAYNEEQIGITWEECTLRKWLNEDFLNSAFNQNEQSVIMVTEVKNNEDNKFGINGGNDTWDRVFLLSRDEAKRYFNDEIDWKATLYDGTEMGYRLRTPGEKSGYTYYVSELGTIRYGWGDDNPFEGYYTDMRHFMAPVIADGDYTHVSSTGFITYVYGFAGLRPALWIDLSK